MTTIIDQAMLWRQFAAAIDMFGSAMSECPDELWESSLWTDSFQDGGFTKFWYVSYHTLFWLDLYLTGEVEGFTPPEPFTLDELDAEGVLPPRVYTREELLGYLEHCRRKGQQTIGALNNEEALRLCTFPWGELPFAELLLDNMRHVQEHGAQMRMFLGQQAGKSARWIARAKD